MRPFLMLLFLFVFSLKALALGPSTNIDKFCLDRQNPNFVKELAFDSKNLMPFKNQGGIAGGGVCWWHSRFQRNALYLTIYKAHLAKPTVKEIRAIIKQIRKAESVVIIPGYKNFEHFASDNENLIQRELEKWQKGDSFLRFSWLKGVSGSPVTDPVAMKRMMDNIYEEVEIKKNIVYNTLQMKGVGAHSWLVVHMVKVGNGYDLEVLDSNLGDQVQVYNYNEGDTALEYQGHLPIINFSPILEYTDEMKKINHVISRQCNFLKN